MFILQIKSLKKNKLDNRSLIQCFGAQYRSLYVLFAVFALTRLKITQLVKTKNSNTTHQHI